MKKLCYTVSVMAFVPAVWMCDIAWVKWAMIGVQWFILAQDWERK